MNRSTLIYSYLIRALLIGVVALPVMLWLPGNFDQSWQNGATLLRSLGQLCGLLGASLFAFNFILAARLQPIEEALQGLPRVYTLHHLCGGVALILLTIHPVLLGLQYLPLSLTLAANFFIPSIDKWQQGLGEAAYTVLATLLIITFFVKIPYQRWRSTHKWLGLALTLATLHVFFIPGELSGNMPLRAYMLLLMAAALSAFLYRTIFGRWLVRRYRYTVSSIADSGQAGTEVVLAAQARPMPHRAGQFFFIGVENSQQVTRETHPFSITSPVGSPTISFAAKPVGDYTSTLPQLQKGTVVQLEGPYGRFLFENGGNNQIWLAGGIGITPFMSYIRSLSDTNEQKIELNYLIKNKSNALFIGELRNAARALPNFSLYEWESDARGRFPATEIRVDTSASYFICGPQDFMQDMKQVLMAAGIKRAAILTEEFKLY